MKQVEKASASSDAPASEILSTNLAVARSFLLSRAAMSAVITAMLFLRGFSTTEPILLILQVVGLAATAIAVVVLAISILQPEQGRALVTQRPMHFILLDCFLAVGVISVIDSVNNPLAWVALITPVLQAAVLFSLVRAATIWATLTLIYLTVRLSLSSGTVVTSETVLLSLQQVVAVLFVAGPAAILADSAQERMERLADDRRDADDERDRMRIISNAARRMSRDASVGELFETVTEAATSLGFDQVEVLVPNDHGDYQIAALSSRGSHGEVPTDFLVDTLGDELTSVSSHSVTHGETLRLAGFHSGNGITIGAPRRGSSKQTVLRAWQRDDQGTVDHQSLELLARHARDAYGALNSLHEAQAHADQLLHEVRHDGLTGLANRAYLMEELALRLAEKQPTALFFVDLDGFKAINDTMGHRGGDEVLMTVADRLAETQREGELIGRLGGDEFVMLAPITTKTSLESLKERGERLAAIASQPVEVRGVNVRVGASIGVAVDDGRLGPDHLISLADTSMYTAKRGGADIEVSENTSAALKELRAV